MTSFLEENPFLTPLLQEAYIHIKEYFPDSDVVLEVVTDPEIMGAKDLVAFIIVELTADEACDPDEVDALILVSSALSGYQQRMTETILAGISQYYGALQQKDIASAVEKTVRFLSDGPRRTPEQMSAQARARITEMSTQHIQWHGDLFASQQHMLPLEPPAINRLAEVKVPTLIVVGEEDTPNILEIADTLEQGMANAKKLVIPGTAHHLNMEEPEEFNRVVLDFLTSASA